MTDIVEWLRRWCMQVRLKPTPLMHAIPMVQKAADEIERLRTALDAIVVTHAGRPNHHVGDLLAKMAREALATPPAEHPLTTNAVVYQKQANIDDKPDWIKVTDQMPASGRVVLAYHKNANGLGRRIRACWIAAKTSKQHGWESDFGDYDEEQDCYYDPEGWYEQMEHWPEYAAFMVCGVEITHWMPLPEEPKE